MSTANLVPETRELSGDDAFETLRRNGRRHLIVDAFQRLRVADGFSHARSLAFLSVLVVVQGTIALVGLASALSNTAFSEAVVSLTRGIAPGPTGQLLTAAASQAQQAGNRHETVAIALGLAGCLFTATTFLGQFERALNRIYGVETDRPTVKKYGFAFLLALVVGVLLIAAFASVAYGGIHTVSFDGGLVDTAWQAARWPLGLVLAAGGLAAVQVVAPPPAAALVVARVRSGDRHLALARFHRAPRRVLPLELDVRRDLRTARRHRRLVAVGAAVIGRIALRRRGERAARSGEGTGVRAARHEEGRRIGTRGEPHD